MSNDIKLSDAEMQQLQELIKGNRVIEKAYEFIEFVQSNPAINTFVAIKKSHTELCEELIEKKIKIFNSENESIKDFDNYQKFKTTALETVNMIDTLRNKLLPEEQIKANKKVKDSSQLFLAKAII